jgi:cytochrome c oxidase cbb3-type subunit 1
MWRAMNDDGTLTYTFVESVKAMHPFYVIRMIGGLMYVSGMIIMLWNVIKTVQMGQETRARIPSTVVHA